MIASVTGIARNECEEKPEEDKGQNEEALTSNREDELKQEEIDRFVSFDAFTAVERSSATSKPLSMTWVIEKRSGEWKARLCARPFGREPRQADDVYTPTPFPTTIRVLLIMSKVRN